MELTKKFKTTTKIMGSTPSLGYAGVLEKYITGGSDKNLLSFADQAKKKNQTIEETLNNILSIFHRDEKGNPIIGSWMMKACLKSTFSKIFNAIKNKNHPKQALWDVAIGLVEPLNINLYNGSLVKKPNGVNTYAMTVKQGNKATSFFKAYEYINAGITGEVTMTFDEDVISEENINYLLDKSGSVGVGAFRERFGKFEWVE